MLLRRIATTLAAAGLLVLPATAAVAAPSAQDVGFLRAAHQANLAEIASGRIAWVKSTDETVKNLAATFMRNHIRMDADLTETARQLKVSLPSQPTEEQQALTARYVAADPQAFDEYFISTQLAAHRDAMRRAEEQAKNGADSSVSELAENATPIIASHHELLVAAAADAGLPGYMKPGART